MLFDPLRHEVLSPTAWDEKIVSATIEKIVALCLKQYSPQNYWPSHPLDDDGTPTVFHNLYFGAAGTIWALEYLHRVGVAPALPDFSSIFEPLFETNHRQVREDPSGSNGLLIADTGLLLLGARLNGPSHVAARLALAVEANQSNPVMELMWGSPGTLIAALLMHEMTGEDQWAEVFLRGTKSLWNCMEWEPTCGCYLWRQELYGSSVLLLGGVHGFAGNVLPLVRGWHLLDSDEQARWTGRIEQSLRATRRHQDGLVNWPASVGPPRPGRTDILVHHCHGAPGIVNCIAGLRNAALDDLLEGAGELIWTAGPLKKGANLCHGTGGNGYAFLKLFQRTQNEKWLTRARRFAMHAIHQYERDLQHYGQLRYSLWTGDPGLAIYLWHCIQGADRFPVTDAGL
jgi:hypothetical protein